MTKICYLHLGLHKTASTSFQATCANSIDSLRDAGITYPIFSCSSANKPNIRNHSIPIYSLFSEEPEYYHINLKWGIESYIKEVNSGYNTQLESFLNDSGKILISGEGISSLSEDSLSKFINKIHCYGYEIKATALVRSPYRAVCSMLQQAIKGGRHQKLISLNNSVSDSTMIRSVPGQAKRVKKLKSIFGKAIYFQRFEDACTHVYGPVGFLLEKFLGQDSSAFEYTKLNESLSNLAVRMQNEFNAIDARIVDKKHNPKFRPFPRKVDKRLAFSGKFLLTEVEYALIEEFLNLEAEELSTIEGLDFSDQTIKFSKPIF